VNRILSLRSMPHGWIALGAALAFVGLAPRPGDAQWRSGGTVLQSPHNVRALQGSASGSLTAPVTDLGGVCVYCHTAHGAGTDGALANRGPIPPVFYMPLGQGAMRRDPQPTGNSALCLSCHGGVASLAQVRRAPLDGLGLSDGAVLAGCRGCDVTEMDEPVDPAVRTGGGGSVRIARVAFGTDLRNHHPISVVYEPERVPGFHPRSEVEANGLVLYDGKVQCATCHDSHSSPFERFLRVDPVGGGLCLVCHVSVPAPGRAHFW